MKDVIMIPTYNEKENVGLIIPEIFNLLPDINILVIDDSSPDGTAQVVKELIAKYPNLKILERNQKTGLGDAYKEGIKEILKDDDVRAIFEMDADGSHSVEYLPKFLEEIEESDLVIGSRYIHKEGIENWEFWREMLSRGGNIYSKILTGLKINDLTAGFICVRANLLRQIDFSKISSAGYAYQIEFKYQCSRIPGVRIKEIPIVFKTRREGESKMSNHIIGEGLKTPLRIFWKRLWRK